MYDSSDRKSIKELLKIINVVTSIEKSEKRGKTQNSFNVRKVIVGNKSDLKM